MKAEFRNNSKNDTYKVEIRQNKDNALIADAFELAAGKSISTLTLLEAPEFGNVDCTVTITAFRDGCRRGNILGVDENAKADEKKADGKVEKVNFEPKKQEPTCPHCGSHQIHVEGHCTTCNECGWSTCSLVEGA